VEYVAYMGKNKILVGKPDKKRPTGRHKHRWEDNIITDLREAGWECVDCIHLALDKDKWWDLVTMVINLLVL